jgi:hypothetical protein
MMFGGGSAAPTGASTDAVIIAADVSLPIPLLRGKNRRREYIVAGYPPTGSGPDSDPAAHRMAYRTDGPCHVASYDHAR